MKPQLLPPPYEWVHLPPDVDMLEGWRLVGDSGYLRIALIVNKSEVIADPGYDVHIDRRPIQRFGNLHDAMVYAEAVELTSAKMA